MTTTSTTLMTLHQEVDTQIDLVLRQANYLVEELENLATPEYPINTEDNRRECLTRARRLRALLEQAQELGFELETELDTYTSML